MLRTSYSAQPVSLRYACKGCGSGFSPIHGSLRFVGTDGKDYAIRPAGDRFVTTEIFNAASFTITVADIGAVVLAIDGEKGLGITPSKDVVPSFELAKLHMHQLDEGGFLLRTAENLFVTAQEIGLPVTLCPTKEGATVFDIGSSKRVTELWSADDPFDETKSTHLWIFNRAVELIVGDQSLGEGAKFLSSYHEEDRSRLRLALLDDVFVHAVKRGIYNADNSGLTDKRTSGFIFSAHFWHPIANRGGWWDPDPAVNAFEYGTDFLQQAMETSDTERSGSCLGLSIHYLEDLTQPMHCGGYPNVPFGAGEALVVAIKNAPDSLPNLFTWSTTPTRFIEQNSRHANYEAWAQLHQNEWNIGKKDLTELDFAVIRSSELAVHNPAGEYWRTAAKLGLTAYRGWIPDKNSPIGVNAPASEGEAPPASFNDPWKQTAAPLIKGAQRLVINLMLSWASKAAAAKKYSHLAVKMSAVNLSIMPNPKDNNTAMLAGATESKDEVWALQAYRDESGNQVIDIKTSQPVFFIRNRVSGKCLVAGDEADGHVYYQQDEKRLNSLWIQQYTGETTYLGAKVSGSSFQDAKHRKYLDFSLAPDGKSGRLTHGDAPGTFGLRSV